MPLYTVFNSHQTQNGQPYVNCEGSGTLPGCGVIEWSQASYGPTFDAQGGGVFAMKWDQDGISVCKPVDELSLYVLLSFLLPPEGNFYRVAVPMDIQQGFPDPSTWPEPTATLEPAGCNILEYFQNHSIIFGELFSSRDAIRGINFDEDITFCGAHIVASSKTRFELVSTR